MQSQHPELNRMLETNRRMFESAERLRNPLMNRPYASQPRRLPQLTTTMQCNPPMRNLQFPEKPPVPQRPIQSQPIASMIEPRQTSVYPPVPTADDQHEDEPDIEPDIEHLLNNNNGYSDPLTSSSSTSESGIVSLEVAAQAAESSEPKRLPDGFEWKVVENDSLNEFLLFVNDYGSLPGQPKQRPEFSEPFLRWLEPHLLLAIVSKRKSKQQIVGTIGLFSICYAYDSYAVDTFHTGMLVVHPRLRGKGMETVLLQEITRRAGVKMNGIIVPSYEKNALKTTDTLYPVSRTGYRWMCRPLNIEKLADTLLKSRATVRDKQILNQAYQIRPTKHIELFRRLSPEHVPYAFDRYQQDAQEKHLRFRRVMTMGSFSERYMPRDHLYSYVLQNNQGMIKDFISFYVIHGVNGFKYAYLAHITYPNETILTILLKNTLYIAKRLEVDFFFMQDIGPMISSVLNALKFKDTGIRTYYNLVNYRSGGPLTPQQCGGLCLGI